MIPVHDCSDIPIYTDTLSGDLYISPLDLVNKTSEQIQEAVNWCIDHQNAYQAADTFSRLGCKYNPQFLSMSDLEEIRDKLPGTPLAIAAARIINGEHEERSITTKDPTPVKKDAGIVYLIEGNGFYKIGKTSKPKDRLKYLSIKLPFPVEVVHTIKCNQITKLEQALHRKFASDRTNGEWFLLDESSVNFIKDIKNGDLYLGL